MESQSHLANMRKITWQPISTFVGLCLIIFTLATATTMILPGRFSLGDFRGVMMVLAWVVYVYAYTIVVYRIFLVIMPLPPGEIHPYSRSEFIYHVYVLFYLIFFLLYYAKRTLARSPHAHLLSRFRCSSGY